MAGVPTDSVVDVVVGKEDRPGEQHHCSSSNDCTNNIRKLVLFFLPGFMGIQVLPRCRGYSGESLTRVAPALSKLFVVN